MKKKNIKKAFNKKTSFALLLGIGASFSPLLVMGSCNVTTSQGDKDKSPGSGNNQNPNQNQDVLSKELQKLTYTALSDEDLKNVTISDAVLDEGVSEKLGFVLPDVFRKYIEKEGEEAAQYTVKVSKTKGSLEINYKYQKTSEKKEKAQKVTMIPYQDNDLSAILEELKNYNATFDGEDEWKNISAEGFSVLVNSFKQLKVFQVKKLAKYANTLQDNLRAYIRKEKDKDTIKYFVTKELEQGQKIIAEGEPVKVSPTSGPILSIINKLKKQFIYSGAHSTITSAALKKLEHARTTVIPEDPNNKFDWDAIKTSVDNYYLPKEEELQDPAATTKGKLEVEKLKGEVSLHWYITYIDANNQPLTDEYITKIITIAPSLEEVKKYDWENAAVLKHGDAPSENLILATKKSVTRIETRDKNNAPVYTYIYTCIIKMVDFRKYNGTLLGASGEAWIASNAETKYFDNIRVLFSANYAPKYEDFIDDNTFNFVPKEIRYMEVQ